MGLLVLSLACRRDPAGPARDPDPPRPAPPTVPAPPPEPTTPAPTGFRLLATWEADLWFGGTQDWEADDVTGDGVLDLVASSWVVPGPLVRDLAADEVGAITLPRASGSLGDVDGDGQVDLWAEGTHGPHVLYGPIVASLDLAAVDAAPGADVGEDDHASARAVDVDGDGRRELAALLTARFAEPPTNRVVVWDVAPDRSGTVARRVEVASCVPAGADADLQWWPWPSGVGDVDGDGDRELLATWGGDPPCLGTYALSEDLRGDVDPLAPTPGFRQLNGLVHPFGDLDGDGTDDWFVQRVGPQGFEQVLLAGPLAVAGAEVGGPELGRDLWFHTPYDFCGIVWMDLDGDGVREFTEATRSDTPGAGACGSGAADEIRLYPSTPAGWTADPPPVARRVPLDAPAEAVSAGVDLDGDGGEELLVKLVDGRVLVLGGGG